MAARGGERTNPTAEVRCGGRIRRLQVETIATTLPRCSRHFWRWTVVHFEYQSSPRTMAGDHPINVRSPKQYETIGGPPSRNVLFSLGRLVPPP
eukprot:5282045-Pyramimonas_sp.AAC.1